MVILSKTSPGKKLKTPQIDVFTGPFMSMEEIIEEMSMQNPGNRGRNPQDNAWVSLNATIPPANLLYNTCWDQ